MRLEKQEQEKEIKNLETKINSLNEEIKMLRNNSQSDFNNLSAECGQLKMTIEQHLVV